MPSTFEKEKFHHIHFLRYFYKNKPEELDEFYKIIKSEKDAGRFETISNINSYTGLIVKVKKKEIINKNDPDVALKVYFDNLLLADEFISSGQKAEDENIKKFLISNVNKMGYISVMSTHEFYKDSEYFKKAPLIRSFTNETKEFITDNFDELFMNDEAFNLGIFIFLDILKNKKGIGKYFEKIHGIAQKHMK